MRFKKSVFLAAFSFAATAVAADEQSKSNKGLGWYLGAGQVSFDSQAANREHIKNTGSSIRLAGEYRQTSLLVNLGISGFFYNDSADFSQTVRDQYGRVTTATSSAQSFNCFGELGFRSIVSNSVNLDFFGGIEQVLGSGRSIENCKSCYNEDINISSGFYLMPKLQVVSDGGWTFSLSYQRNLSGDVVDVVAISIGKRN